MSALPIIETQKSQTVGLLTTNKERELGSDRLETGYFYLADAIVFASICEATMRGTHSSDDDADDDDADEKKKLEELKAEFVPLTKVMKEALADKVEKVVIAG